MKMFNIIGIGERAGSGVPDIYDVWETQGWETPVVEEQYNPDRTILTLSFVQVGNIENQEDLKYQGDTLNDTLDQNDTLETLILEQIKKNPRSKQIELAEITGSSIATIKRTMKKMTEQGIIQREGGKRNGIWIIVK